MSACVPCSYEVSISASFTEPQAGLEALTQNATEMDVSSLSFAQTSWAIEQVSSLQPLVGKINGI